MNPRRRIFLWAPEFGTGPGGIQQYTREVLWALGELFGPQNVFGLSYGAVDREFVAARMSGCATVEGVPRPLRGAAFALRALREARRFRPDLILSTFPRFAPVGWACRRLLGVPFVTAAHGVEVWGRQSFLLRRSLGAANRVLAVSEYTARRMREENGMPFVSVLPNCVDGARFATGPRNPELASRVGIHGRVLLTVARLDASERAKGVEVVLRALPEIRQSLPDLVYIIAGDGNDRQRLEAVAREIGVQDVVRFAGRVSEDELPDLYRLCDAFVMPSSKEGFGIVFLEALATGKPVIAGGRDGSVDALRCGELGWLVDPDSVGAVARAVVMAIDDTGDERRNGAFLRERVLAIYGRDAFRDRLHAEIQAVVTQ